MPEEMIICRCEEVTEKEIIEAVKEGAHTINSVKKRVRAGMGLCQGKSCSRLVARIIAKETGKHLAEILPSTVRPPVRPLKISLFRSEEHQ